MTTQIDEDFEEFLSDNSINSIFDCPKCGNKIDIEDEDCDGELYDTDKAFVFSCDECGLSFESWCSKSFSWNVSLRKPSIEKEIARKEKDLEKIKSNPDKNLERQDWLVSRLESELKSLKEELEESV